MRWSIRITVFIAISFLVGVVIARWVGGYLESAIEFEAFQDAVRLVGKPFGLKKITDQFSYWDALLLISEFVALPWSLLFGLTGTLVVEWLINFLRTRVKLVKPENG
jgi:hypothetical protein